MSLTNGNTLYAFYPQTKEMESSKTKQHVRTNTSSSKGCKACYSRLADFKRQTMKIMKSEYQKSMNGNGIPPLENLLHIVYKNLSLNEQLSIGLHNDICTLCGLPVDYLKRYSLITLQSASVPGPYVATPLKHPKIATQGEPSDLNTSGSSDLSRTTVSLNANRQCASPTAAHFFTEAARKFNIPNKRKQQPSRSQPQSPMEGESIFPTNFSWITKTDPPPNPPGLFKYMGRRVDGKVSVMLRLKPDECSGETDSFIEVDQRRKQISIVQPKNSEHVPAKYQISSSAPKLFAFDSIFEADMSQSRVTSNALLDVLHAVINGGEGCLLSYGASSVGKTNTMVGKYESNKSFGIMPSAISWMYSLIEDCKQRTGARISVRVSAVEVVGPTENLKDLLSEQTSGADSTDSSGASPGIYLREDPIGGTFQLGNVSEPQAVSAEKAAFYLDAALAARSTVQDHKGETQNSHMIFTLHIYQYRVDKTHKSRIGTAVPYSGGRSRLHLIDLSCVNSKFNQMQNGVTPSHAGLGQIIVAMLNGFKQLPYRDSKMTRLLKDSIGNPTCRTTLIAHVSAEEKNFAKTFATIQMVSKIHRSRRKRNKYCSSSSDTSCDEARRRRPHAPLVKTYGIDDSYLSSDCNTSSAGEDSCDTVIYMGTNGQLSDRDLSDNERPPSPNTISKIKLKLASSSEDESHEFKLQTSSNEDEKVIQEEKVQCEISKDINILNLTQSPKPVRWSKENSLLPGTTNTRGTTNVEKAVNIVTPLIIKPQNSVEEKQKDELKTPQFEFQSIIEKAPSEKELRKREKRIAKLLKEGITDDVLDEIDSFPQSPIDGYISDMNAAFANTNTKSSVSSGYISAPESFYSKPIQIVKGTVRKQEPIKSLENDDDLKTDVFHEKTSATLDAVFEKTEQEHIMKETCLDDVCTPVKYVTPNHAQVMGDDESKTICDSIDKIFSDIESEISSNLKNEKFTSSNDIYKDSDLSSATEFLTLLETQYSNHVDIKNSSDTVQFNKSPIQNLEHIITISKVPDFTVMKRHLNDLSSTPQSTPNIESGSDLIEFKTPHFSRSYSREDTASLVSGSNMSEMYDSDVNSSASPALNKRTPRPTRLRYRWSTVFEEDENKKENRIEKIRMANNESSSNLPSKSPKVTKKLESKSPKFSKRFQIFNSNKSTDSIDSPKLKKTVLLSPKSEKKLTKLPATEKRISHCSDSSSGIGSNSSNSQSSSLQSREEIKIDYTQPTEKEIKTRMWFFGRRPKKSRSYTSGYMSDGLLMDNRSSRKNRLFGSKSKSSLYTDGHSSGYETTATETGMTSCADDLTDSESTHYTKKKKRFLNFRRRSTNDLKRVKKPAWFDGRHCQSDDEGLQIKFYEIDEPRHQSKRHRCKSESAMNGSRRTVRLEELRLQQQYLKNIASTSSSSYNPKPDPKPDPCIEIEKEIETQNQSMSKKLRAIKSHIQVVTCFDGQPRKTTQI